MKRHILISAAFAAAAFVAVAPAASALTAAEQAACSKQAKDIKSGQAAAKRMQAQRDALIEKVDLAGETWQEAQSMRNYGADKAAAAAAADAARAEYDALSEQLRDLEYDLQDRVFNLNNAVNSYNRRCATK